MYPNGLDTSYYWQYGTSTAYGQQTPAKDVGSGTDVVSTSTVISRLQPSTSYHYRLVAENSAGTSYGYDYTLTTLDVPPGNSIPPSIAGNAHQGQTLTASAGTWSGSPGYTYQWQSSSDGGTWTNIAGATSSIYIPVDTDVGDIIRVTVTAANAAGSTTDSSSPVGPVVSAAPYNTLAPTIAGTPDQGYVLNVSSSWNPAGSSYTFQWQRSTGAAWTAIGGATSQSYTLQPADEGASVRVIVTAVNTFGQASATSASIGPVQSDPPVNTLAPVLSGIAQRTYTLTATQGTWSGAGNAYGYQWQRSSDGQTWTAIAGATGASYMLGQSDEGDLVRALVSASNPDGVASVPSNVTATIISPYPPANTIPPTIGGTAERTDALSASPGTWSGPDLTFAYQWQHDAGEGYVNIQGATNPTYTLQASDEGAVVRVLVSASNLDATIQEASQPSAVVQDAVPVDLAAPTVTGTVQRASVLSGDPGVWGGLGNTYVYQWQRSTDGTNWNAIAGSTDLTYTLSSADEGSSVRLLVTATNADGSAAVASQATATVPSSPPANSAAPTITGAAQRGSTLQGTQGTWSGIGNTYSYQWQRSTDGKTWASVAAQTGTTYTLTTTDEGAVVRLLVTATNPDGTLAVASQPTATVQATPPANSVPPTIAGTAQRDNQLSASQGTWSGIGNTYAYQWQHSTNNGSTWSNVQGATSSTYMLARSDEGSQLRAQVTASNPDGSVSFQSAPSSVVSAAAPQNTSVPTVTGTTERTYTLTAGQGTWSGLDNTYAYQWQRSSNSGATWGNIQGATFASYTLTQSDEAMLVRVQVTGGNPDGTVSVPSAASGPVLAAPPINTLAPSVTGLAQRTATLTATHGTWSGPDNTYGYQWQRCDRNGQNCQNIAGATTGTYTVAVADESATVRVQVSAANPDAPDGIDVVSAPTAVIPSAPPVLIAQPTIAGSAQRGQILTGTSGTWSGIGNTYSYQWQRNSGSGYSNVAGATTLSYLIGLADENATVRLVVTVTNPDGNSTATSPPTTTVPSAPPTNDSPPLIAGTAQRAGRLTSTLGSWGGIGNTYAYQWQHSVDDSTWSNLERTDHQRLHAPASRRGHRCPCARDRHQRRRHAHGRQRPDRPRAVGTAGEQRCPDGRGHRAANGHADRDPGQLVGCRQHLRLPVAALDRRW